MKEKYRKIKEYIRYHKGLQYILIWAGLLAASLLGTNNNYHVLSWINRVLPPVQYKGITLFTGTIILIIVIYNLFRAFYFTTGNYLFNKGWKCLICTLIFVNMLNGINPGITQKIRSLHSGVQAVYLCREEPMGMNIYHLSEKGQEGYKLKGCLTLRNCSDRKTGPFTLTVVLPKSEDKTVSGTFKSDRSYDLGGKEQKTITFELTGIMDDSSLMKNGSMYLTDEPYEVILEDAGGQVKFYSE